MTFRIQHLLIGAVALAGASFAAPDAADAACFSVGPVSVCDGNGRTFKGRHYNSYRYADRGGYYADRGGYYYDGHRHQKRYKGRYARNYWGAGPSSHPDGPYYRPGYGVRGLSAGDDSGLTP